MNQKNYVNFSESEKGVYRDGVEIPFKEKWLSERSRPVDTTLIVTNFNRANMIRRAIDSALRCNQKRSSFEVMVVDDGSSDASIDAIRECTQDKRVSLIALKGNTGSEALPKNIAAHFARGRYLSYLDSDDRLGDADAFDACVQAIEGRSDVVMTVSNLVFEIQCTREELATNMPWLLDVDLYSPDEKLKSAEGKEYRRRIAKEHPVYELLNHAYYDAFKLMRRDAFMQTGGIVEDLMSCGDFGTYLRLNRHGKTLPIPRDFYIYTIHGENNSFYSDGYRRFQEAQHRVFALGEIRLRGLTYDDLRQNCQQEFWERYRFTREEVEDANAA